MRMIHTSDVEEELAFAKRAAIAFAKDPKIATYSDKLFEQGSFIAIRWGMGEDCVVVVKLDENHVATNYQNLVKEFIQ